MTEQPRWGRIATTCTVCPHVWAAHDALGQRFCRATRDVGWERRCICRQATARAEPSV